jgi:hypothetical protein
MNNQHTVSHWPRSFELLTQWLWIITPRMWRRVVTRFEASQEHSGRKDSLQTFDILLVAVVNRVNRLRDGRSGVWIPAGARDLSLFQKSSPALLPTCSGCRMLFIQRGEGKVTGVWGWLLTSIYCRDYLHSSIHVYGVYTEARRLSNVLGAAISESPLSDDRQFVTELSTSDILKGGYKGE